MRFGVDLELGGRWANIWRRRRRVIRSLSSGRERGDVEGGDVRGEG